jgi:hypothetical protein
MRTLLVMPLILVLGCSKTDEASGQKKVETVTDGNETIIKTPAGEIRTTANGDAGVLRMPDGKEIVGRRTDGDKYVVTMPDGEEQKFTMKKDGDTMSITSDSGVTGRFSTTSRTGRVELPGMTMTFGKNEVPKDFPLNVYPGSEVISSGRSTSEGARDMLQLTTRVQAQPDKVLKHYEKLLKERGFKVERDVLKTAQGTWQIMNGTSKTHSALIMLGEVAGFSGTTVGITWDKLPDFDDLESLPAKDVPKECPVPLYPTSEVLLASRPKTASKPAMSSVIIEAKATPEEVVTFYDKALKEKGFKVDTKKIGSGKMDLTVITGRSEKLRVSVHVHKQEGDHATTSSIYWRPAP